jgi:hypothetical protein
MDSMVFNGIQVAIRDLRLLPPDQATPDRIRRMYLLILNLMPTLGSC